MLYRNMQEFKKIVKGFTLTEVLVALGIVGVIAALVLPAVITHYNDSSFASAFKREKQAIKASLDALTINENKANFGDTIMYSASDPDSYENNAGTFIKKYLKISKYYGDTVSNLDDIKSKCFAEKYYQYSGNDKKVYEPAYKGACATLKNGASICLEPQIGSQGVRGIIDLNGPKGPNVVGRDYNEFGLDRITFSDENSISKVLHDPSDPKNSVFEEGFTPLTTDEGNPCGENDSSNACCKYRSEHSLLPTGSDDPCCLNTTYSSGFGACAKEINLVINYYPTSDCTNGCQPYLQAVGTTSSKTLTVNPPNISLYCDGRYVTYMSGATLRDAVNATSGNFNFAGKNTTTVNCKYNGQTTGKTSQYSSVTFSNGSADITQNNIKWHIDKH